MDEPIGDPAIISTYSISEAAKENSTVLLSGVGGDEIFAGYPRHKAMKMSDQFQTLPTALKNVMLKIGNVLPGGVNAQFRNINKFASSTNFDPFTTYMNMLSYFPPSTHKDLFTEDFYNEFCQEDVYQYHRNYFDKTIGQPFLNRIQYLDLKTFLPCLNLAYTDRMSMAASVEVRVPMLDNDIIDKTLSLPISQKLHGYNGKFALKKSQVGFIPSDIIWRKKAGFGAPIQSWLINGMIDQQREFFDPEYLRKQNIFNPKTIINLIQANKDKSKYYANHIWQILTFQIWHNMFIDSKKFD